MYFQATADEYKYQASQ